jgi:hypothetical protein
MAYGRSARRLALALLGGAHLLGCWDVSKNEVARVPGPSDRLDAVLVEVNAGATTSFSYRIYIVPAGAQPDDDHEVVVLDGASRSDSAYGANLRWAGPHELRVEYQSARVHRYRPIIDVASRQIGVRLDSGVADFSAPGGGMLCNLDRTC